MTPKEILKHVVSRMFHGLDIEDLTREEKRVVSYLKDHGVLTIRENDDEDEDYKYQTAFVNWEYFDEGKSPAVEEPEEA